MMMAQIQRAFLTHLYRKAGRPEELPWHSEKPPELLELCVANAAHKGRALDVGCGSGVFSLWLAQRGYQVTAVDFMAEAARMTRERVRELTPEVEVVHASVLDYAAREPFDLVLDRGCLHTLDPSVRPRYRDQVLRWLKPGGSYVLVHLGRRHAADWRPVGPRRRSREEILELFGPELREVEHRSMIAPLPLPVGPTVQLNSYWLRRTEAQ
jgi:2-polyprenyl-3-methyl-5-hydroxy-6-metoxy-1,4-benzoquinol methylase